MVGKSKTIETQKETVTKKRTVKKERTVEEAAKKKETAKKKFAPGRRTAGEKKEMPQKRIAEGKKEMPQKRIAGGKKEMTQKRIAGEKKEMPQKRIEGGKKEMPQKRIAGGKKEMPEKRMAGRSELPICPAAEKCGGCVYQGMPYEIQLEKKQRYIESLLKNICPVRPIIGMENPFNYRNKVHAVFGRLYDGTILSGTYEKNSHRIVPIESCMIEDACADAIIRDTRGLLKSFKIKIYNEDSGFGLFRHVLIRRGFATGQVLVVLVAASPVFPSKNNFVKALLKLHPEITSIVLNINDKKTSMILGDREIVLYGKGYIEDVLCGRTFRISPKSFYQVNPVQTEVLYGNCGGYYEPSTHKGKVTYTYGSK